MNHSVLLEHFYTAETRGLTFEDQDTLHKWLKNNPEWSVVVVDPPFE